MTPTIPVLKKRAKAMAQEAGLTHSGALDTLASEHGFQSWSHLVAQAPKGRAAQVLADLRPGDMLLLAARPGQGKTLMGLELAVTAGRDGRAGHFFTLDYGPGDVAERLELLDNAPQDAAPIIDTSDGITAAYIISEMIRSGSSFGVIDYLQLLDQRRSDPALNDQLRDLAAYAKSTGAIYCLLSQVDRAFDASPRDMPELSDIRQPNPFSTAHFTATCFLHECRFRFDRI